MTAPALPGAAPDPARLPPEVESAIRDYKDAVIRYYTGSTSYGGQSAPAADYMVERGNALRTAIARALRGDGEPVAWGVFDKNNCLWRSFDSQRDAERESASLNAREDTGHYRACGPYRVEPLSFTRPAATGDTGEVERARAAFYEAAVKWAAASKRDLACRDPYSSQERVNARMGTVDAHLGALAAYDALLAATWDHPSEARRGHESEGRGGPDAR